MTTGRIEIYAHSDSTTENKGAVMIKVTSDTDFAARTESFREFAHQAAMRVYAAMPHTRVFVAGPDMWALIVAQYPELEDQRRQLERELKETIKVCEFAILRM